MGAAKHPSPPALGHVAFCCFVQQLGQEQGTPVTRGAGQDGAISPAPSQTLSPAASCLLCFKGSSYPGARGPAPHQAPPKGAARGALGDFARLLPILLIPCP